MLGESFSPLQVADLIDHVQQQATEAIERASRISKTCQSFLNFTREELLLSEQLGFSFYPDANWLERLNQYDTDLRHEIFGLYRAVFTTTTTGSFLSLYEAQESAFLQKNADVEGVAAAVKDGRLYIKLPILGHKKTRRKGKGNNVFYSDYELFFSESVRTAIRLLGDRVPPFPVKNIAYFFVYRSTNSRPPDSDNHDTKAITDAITYYLINGDMMADLRGIDTEDCVASYVYTDIEKEDDGTRIYVVSEPKKPILESEMFRSNSISLLSLLTLGQRLMHILRVLNRVGKSLSTFDLETIYVLESGNHPVQLGNMMYGYQNGIDFTTVPTIPLTAHGAVRKTGYAPNFKAGMVALGSLLWLLADGCCYTDEPQFQRTGDNPRYVSKEIRNLLITVMNTTEANADTTEAMFSDIINKVQKGEIGSVPIPVPKISYPEPTVTQIGYTTSRRSVMETMEELPMEAGPVEDEPVAVFDEEWVLAPEPEDQSSLDEGFELENGEIQFDDEFDIDHEHNSDIQDDEIVVMNDTEEFEVDGPDPEQPNQVSVFEPTESEVQQVDAVKFNEDSLMDDENSLEDSDKTPEETRNTPANKTESAEIDDPTDTSERSADDDPEIQDVVAVFDDEEEPEMLDTDNEMETDSAIYFMQFAFTVDLVVDDINRSGIAVISKDSMLYKRSRSWAELFSEDMSIIKERELNQLRMYRFILQKVIAVYLEKGIV